MTVEAGRGVVPDGVLLAAGTFTVLPVAPPSTVDAARARTAMLLAPLAVTPLALGVCAVVALGSVLGWPGMLTGALAVGVLAVGTRVLHLDGLADTADGLSAPYDRERRLAIMKSGDVGPAGVAALVLVLVLQAAALGALAARPYGWLLAGVLVCASRAACAIVCARPVPAAAPTGLGAAVAGSVPLAGAVAVGCFVAAALAGAVAATGEPWWLGPLAVVAAALCVALLVRRAISVLGGITGDVIGASVELALAALCVVALTAA
ncbi:adenosylcobinamide-GDP ribazoletransferase [Mumia quercus]|uniref:adenosylcobinamide-GDP ribazoletransferase n=1 Tax=Mumia quercus TaxID=2976125 RepID=UPI0021D2726C|nr:adenosylcobinamide-GDP ribazoletransferase [Mumia quercus]